MKDIVVKVAQIAVGVAVGNAAHDAMNKVVVVVQKVVAAKKAGA